MNKFKSLIVATALASSFMTTGFASQVVENTETMKKFVVNMGQADTSPIQLDDEAGWGGGEGSHRWTTGQFPSFSVPVTDGDKRLSRMILNMHALASDSHPQTLEVYLQNNVDPDHNDTYKNMNPFQITLTIPETFAEQHAIPLFYAQNFCKPEVIDPSNKDPRTLAFAFTTVELEYTKK